MKKSFFPATKAFVLAISIFFSISVFSPHFFGLLHAEQPGNIQKGERILDLARRLQQLIQQKSKEGVDVSGAMDLNKGSRRAMKQGNRVEAEKLLREAIEKLGGELNETPSSAYKEPRAGGPPKKGARPGGIDGKIRTYLRLLTDAKEKGLDVSEAERLNESSRKAARAGNPKNAKKLLEQAIVALGGTGDTTKPNAPPGQKQISNLASSPEPDLPAGNIEPIYMEPKKYFDSPFGIHGPYITILEDSLKGMTIGGMNDMLKDLGVKWIQITPRAINAERLRKSGINAYLTIGPLGGSMPPDTTERYKSELRSLVRKYKGLVTYWEVGTEPSGMGWNGHEKEYVKRLRETYKILKNECPDCMAVHGGLVGLGTGYSKNSKSAKFFSGVLKAGGGRYFDVLEFKQHTFNADEYRELKNKMTVLGQIMAENGLDINKIQVFVETATYDGNPKPPPPLRHINLPAQSEKQQAAGVVKLHVYGLSNGIDKFLWNQVVERFKFGGRGDVSGSFDYYGLVNNPDNDSKSYKKLSYYTYKKMVEILGGSSWKDITAVKEGPDVYVYRFRKRSGNVWVAWNDSHKAGKIALEGIQSKKVKVTEAVPSFDTGADVKEYQKAFNISVYGVHEYRIAFEAGSSPVFIEEIF